MTKKSTKKQGRYSPLATLIALVIIAVFAILNQLGIIETEPTATATPPPTRVVLVPTGNVQAVMLDQGIGAIKDFWQVYFTAPTGSTDRSTYVGGVDTQLIDAINNVQGTLDIAAFEWNNPALTEAVINAHERGVEVRMTVDDEHTLEDDDSTIEDIIDAGISVVDDDRNGLMHNKFMIMDGSTVWTGSMNYTINGTYRNNNNLVSLRSRRAVEVYQTEFNEMFVSEEFGSKRSTNNSATFNQDGTQVQIMFSPEDNVVPNVLERIQNAESDIRFMAFSYTLDELGEAMRARAEEGVNIQGIFEVRGSETEFSEMPAMFCAGLDVRQDGNSFTFHHKVIIIDNHTVLTGSFNFSDNATNDNDENMLIIQDADFAAQYIAEFERAWSQATPPDADDITCP